VDLAHEFINETRVFGDLIAAGRPSAPVRTCPGWNLTQLLKHVGRGNRWAAEIVLHRHQEAIDPSTVPEGKPPRDMVGAIEWLHAGALKLNDAVAEEHDAVVWTFTGPQPASWWVRRRLHETVVHRADAAIAVGTKFVVDPVVGADTISEWLDLATNRGGVPWDTIHLHAVDSDLNTTGEWTIADGLWSHEHAKGDVALRGHVTDLLLALTRRRTVADSDLEVFGDEAVWQSWLDATPF
jgi:uncharacterized protein (TIGR03083 family)